LVPQDLGGNHRAFRQRDADLVGACLMRERKDPVVAAEAAMQTAQAEAIRVVRCGSESWWKAFYVRLRTCPRDVGEEPWPFGRGRRAEKLSRRGQLTVSTVDRRS